MFSEGVVLIPRQIIMPARSEDFQFIAEKCNGYFTGEPYATESGLSGLIAQGIADLVPSQLFPIFHSNLKKVGCIYLNKVLWKQIFWGLE